MSLSGVIDSRPEPSQWSPALVLVALVIAKIALGVLADRVGQEVQVNPALAAGPVAWDDRTGNPVTIGPPPSPQDIR
jgi:hypothetical protein